TETEYQQLEAWARERFQIEEPIWRWSAQDFKPADDLPYMGLAAPNSHVYVATGFMKWGLTNGTAAAIAISESILGRAAEWSAPFAAQRVAPLKSAKIVLEQGLETTRSIMMDCISPPGSKSIEDLEPGQGAVLHAC